MPLPGRDLDRQGQAVAVGPQVDLRAETAAGAAQGVVGRLTGYFFFDDAPAAARLARMEEPSTHPRS